MTDLKVSFAGLATASADANSAAGKMNGQLEALRSYLAPMVASWDGDAQAAYRVKQQQWDTAAAELNQVLGKISAALATAGQNYEQAERANTQTWT